MPRAGRPGFYEWENLRDRVNIIVTTPRDGGRVAAGETSESECGWRESGRDRREGLRGPVTDGRTAVIVGDGTW